jgi:hypothetical protein
MKHTNNVLIDLDHMINAIRYSNGALMWDEACDLSSVGMATFEDKDVKASINKHGSVTVQDHPRNNGETIEEIKQYLMNTPNWVPISPKVDSSHLGIERNKDEYKK